MKNKMLLLTIPLVIFFIFSCGRAKPKEILVDIDRDFDYMDKGGPMGLSSGQTQGIGLEDQPFEVLKKEPAYNSNKVMYGYIKLGNGEDQKYSFAVDDMDKDHWVIYFDANNNEDLTDDGPAHRNQGSGKMATTISLKVELKSLSDEKFIRPYNFWIWIKELRGKPIPKFYSRCHHKGQITVKGGEKYTAVAFEKSNHDALYRESGLWIDMNKDGKLDKETENFKNVSTVRFGKNEYILRLAYP